MRALVTGAAGFVGSHLCERCLAEGWDVVAVDCLTPYYDAEIKRSNAESFRWHPQCDYHEVDLLGMDLEEVLGSVDVVFHLAAQAGVRASWGQSFDVYTQLNITAVQRLLEAAKSANLSKFVFASSSSVYGDAEDLPTSEDQMLKPVSPYGATKALGEHLAYLYWKSFGVPAVSLRFFTVYGPRQRPDMAFNRLIAAAKSGSEFVLYGDGEQTRDFTYVDDTVSGVVAAALRGRPGQVYNLGTGSTISMNEVVELVEDVAGPVNVRRVLAQRGDARATSADIGRARSELGYAPWTPIHEGLRAQARWQLGVTNLELAL